jgi:SAM-dependent methyltransferase
MKNYLDAIPNWGSRVWPSGEHVDEPSANREWHGAVIPPADIVPCGRLTRTAEKFFTTGCADADRLIRDAGLDPSSAILDIGCGAGRLPIGLLARDAPFASYLGVDVSQIRIDWCARNLSARDPRLRFQRIGMRNERYNPDGSAGLDLQVEPASFDVAFLYSVFSHMREPDVRAYLELIARALRPGGLCFVVMFTDSNVPPVTENPADFAPMEWRGPLHCVRYDDSYWRGMVEDAGLTILRRIPDFNPDSQTAFYLAKPVAPAAVERTPTPRSPGRAPRCFVGFFGINRSLRWTFDSIRQSIFEPLDAFGCETVRAAHFNCPDVVHSPRSGEFNIPLDMSGIEQLGLQTCWPEPQLAENISRYLPIVLDTSLGGDPDGDGAARKNVLHQLHSLRRLAQLIALAGESDYDVYCLLRADLMYVDPMPVAEIFDLIAVQGVDVVTASWHRWGGANDRFAFCSRRGAAVYLNRIDWLRHYCLSTSGFQSESLLRYAFDQSGLRSGFTGMRAKRVRATGAIRDEDFSN